METTKMLKIFVLALTLIVWSAAVSKAEPMGTAWTYQGRLMDANSVADGRYDFQFKLYYGPAEPNQVGGTADVNDIDVIDGYFTAELNFGSDVFDGNSVWLQIDVRPGDSNDPNAFVTLSPRQELTPVPYALQTRGIFVDSRGNVGVGTTRPTGKLHVDGGKAGKALHVRDGESIVLKAQDGADALFGGIGGIGGNIILQPGEGGLGDIGMRMRPGRVGIGTDKPDATLDVRGNVKITGGSPDAGKVLTSDASGLATWQSLSVLSDGDWAVSGSDMYSIPTGNVGIGTSSPEAKLDVRGTLKVDQRISAYDSDGLIFTNDAGLLSLYIADSGHVGIGQLFPSFPFHVKKNYDTGWISGIHNVGTGPDAHGLIVRADGGEPLLVQSASTDILCTTQSGNVGIGTRDPVDKLHVKSRIRIEGSDTSYPFLDLVNGAGTGRWTLYGNNDDEFHIAEYVGTIRGVRFMIKEGGNVGIGTTSPGAKLDVAGRIRVSDMDGDPIVEIGEGLDYAEGFNVTEEADIEAGTVLVIDSENPGKLTVSRSAYDSKVAGIVAGANGMGSGVRLGVSQFDQDVALAGRVYCNVDATETSVEPGDLLTTSATAGYAMKATDYDRARGAILGKAMEKLEQGKKEQILVLVTLQ
jgi:hypothetical protein